MRKILLSVLGLLLALTVGAQTNLVTNPDFETGDDTGWIGYNRSVIMDADAFQGDYVGSINNNKDGSFRQNGITVEPGKTYLYSFAGRWPFGTSVGMKLVLKNTDGGALVAETAPLSSTGWSIERGEVTIPAGVTSVFAVLYKAKSPLFHVDNVVIMEKTSSSPAPDLTMASDGEILEDYEDGEVITVTMTNDAFADPITPSNWSFYNLPKGVTVGSASRVSDTEVSITLSGNTTEDYDVDKDDLLVVIDGAEFVNYTYEASVNTGVTFTANVEVTGLETVFEENFDDWTPDIELDSLYMRQQGDYFGWGTPEKFIVTAGALEMYTGPDGADNWIQKEIDVIPGANYIYSVDLKTDNASKTFAIVWRAVEVPVNGSDVVSATLATSVAEFQVDPDQRSALLGAYKYGNNRVLTIDNMKLELVTEPMLDVSTSASIIEGSEDGVVVSVKALYETFVASPDVANWSFTGLPDGVTLSAPTRVSDTQIDFTLVGNSNTDYDADINVIVSVGRDELVTSSKPLSTSFKFEAVVEVPAISMADDGEILEGAEDGEVITVISENDTFVATLTPASWTFTGLPAGVSLSGANRVDDTTVELTLSGPATEDYDADIALSLTVLASEFTVSDVDLTAAEGATLVATVEPAALSMTDDGDITEGSENGEVITVTVEEDTFVATLSPASWTFTGLPAGVSLGGANRVDDTTVELTLSGTATDDYDVDITDVSLTVLAAEFVQSASDLSATTGVTFTAVVETGLSSNFAGELKIYPNPVVDQLNIAASSRIATIVVHDMLGNKVYELNEVNDDVVEMSVSHWNAGIYMISVISEEGASSTSKIVL